MTEERNDNRVEKKRTERKEKRKQTDRGEEKWEYERNYRGWRWQLLRGDRRDDSWTDGHRQVCVSAVDRQTDSRPVWIKSH